MYHDTAGKVTIGVGLTLLDAIKIALPDMTCNLGPQGLFHGFLHLISAIQSGNWSLAADHYTRRVPAPACNDWTRHHSSAPLSPPSKPRPNLSSHELPTQYVKHGTLSSAAAPANSLQPSV
ncbi:MAG TPA: hypothetical protein VNU92_09925 [Edaphobacter sp.]|nr:hypothetical protein [Edaphobacter sp.]